MRRCEHHCITESAVYTVSAWHGFSEGGINELNTRYSHVVMGNVKYRCTVPALRCRCSTVGIASIHTGRICATNSRFRGVIGGTELTGAWFDSIPKPITAVGGKKYG